MICLYNFTNLLYSTVCTVIVMDIQYWKYKILKLSLRTIILRWKLANQESLFVSTFFCNLQILSKPRKQVQGFYRFHSNFRKYNHCQDSTVKKNKKKESIYLYLKYFMKGQYHNGVWRNIEFPAEMPPLPNFFFLFVYLYCCFVWKETLFYYPAALLLMSKANGQNYSTEIHFFHDTVPLKSV